VNAAHDELKHDAAAYALGVLEPAERAAFEAHLSSCAECAAEVRQMRLAASALPYTVPQVSPPPSLRARILDQAVRGVGPSDPADRKAGPGVATVAVVRERRGPPAWLQIAAMLVVGAGVFLYAQRMQARVSNLEAQLAQAQAQVATSDRLTAEARTVALRAQSAMGVFAAPDVARIDLAGQPAAVSARARALWSRQRGMVFTATNLPALPAGRVYQVWVVTAQAPVSAGLLTPDASGGGSVYFETPVDILPPVAVAVTLEPAGGVPAPTGAMYLVGKPSPL
jgi:anti-sigma-K factor RskA